MKKSKKEKVENVFSLFVECSNLKEEERKEKIKEAYSKSKQVGMLVELFLDCEDRDLLRTKENILDMAKQRRAKGESTFINKMIKEFFEDFSEYVSLL